MQKELRFRPLKLKNTLDVVFRKQQLKALLLAMESTNTIWPTLVCTVAADAAPTSSGFGR